MKHYILLMVTSSMLHLTLNATPFADLQIKYQTILDAKETLQNLIKHVRKEIADEESIAHRYSSQDELDTLKRSYQYMYIHAWKHLLRKYRKQLKKLTPKEEAALEEMISLQRRMFPKKEKPTPQTQKRNFLYRTLAHFRPSDSNSADIQEKRKSLF